MIGNEYIGFGTMDKKVWRKSLKGNALRTADPLEHVADFKKELVLNYDPGGWRPV